MNFNLGGGEKVEKGEMTYKQAQKAYDTLG